MSCQVMTAAGPVSSNNLGATNCHDHLVWGPVGWDFDATYTYDREFALKKCIKEVKEAKKCGLGTILDATVSDLPRDPEFCRQIQEATGVNIICATGLCNEKNAPSAYWVTIINMIGYDEALKRLYPSFMKELTVGICGSNVRSGMIKVSAFKGEITKFEELCMEAAAMAQKATGVPIISHTEAGTMGPEMADFLLSKGADPKKVMIGHMGECEDLEGYVKSVLKKGVYIGLDRMGLSMMLSDERRCQNLIKLIDMGYIKQILLGHDYTVYAHGPAYLSEAIVKTMPNYNLCGTLAAYNPMLKKLGLSDKQLKTLEVDNPRRFFEGA